MKKRIISFILCVVMCCAIFPASAFAVGTDTQQGGYYQGSESPAMLELKEWQAKHPVVAPEISLTKHEKNLSGLHLSAIAPTAITPSDSFKKGKYGIALSNLSFSGDQRADIVKVVQSQIGYHESNSDLDLSGTTNGTGNYTEYGRVAKNNGVAWGGYFANWCGYQVEYNTPLMWLSTKTYDSSKIQVGDVVIMRNGENIGIVTYKQGTTIRVVEGNYSDQVYQKTYSINDSALSKYASPNYSGWAKTNGYWYFVNSDGSPKTGWLESADKWYYLDPATGGRMVTGAWDIEGSTYTFDSTGALISGNP